MNTAIVTKQFQFHAAHQLPNHDGKCRNLHGHTYRVDVSVRGKIKDLDGTPDEGMVIDFDRLKEAWVVIDEAFDHKYLNDILEVPTAERIARWILTRLQEDLQRHLVITVWETSTSCVEVQG
jgi:6-pyruvoyltetrahydropterin/6-carboxytetrahydropterin synthase